MEADLDKKVAAVFCIATRFSSPLEPVGGTRFFGTFLNTDEVVPDEDADDVEEAGVSEKETLPMSDCVLRARIKELPF